MHARLYWHSALLFISLFSFARTTHTRLIGSLGHSRPSPGSADLLREAQGVASLPLSVAILGDWEVPQRPPATPTLVTTRPRPSPVFFRLFPPISPPSHSQAVVKTPQTARGRSRWQRRDWAASYSSTVNRQLQTPKIPTRNVTQPASTGTWYRENVKSLPAGPGGSLSQ
ncbi:hypothetical protein ASA_2234 [Aeromonas salmonicida subsp. salmonicida A449]|uniref:Uncharacterized protein n=1 Tax=Aeromonas salmonicida (strain A449) TaxID=382245 RepID=A4SN22_AERS4|nr:hypothetical protein ASA_2234 [Aeromonas salmonicida subsp. salmonicida A449]